MRQGRTHTTNDDRLPRTRTGNPVLRCTDDVLHYWIERVYRIAPEREHFSYSSMICTGDSLFHYGQHFELGRILRDKRGRARLILLNGDTWNGASGFGPSTSSRQRDCRSAAGRTNVPSMVVPFSALDGAGIDYTTVQPIAVRGDRETREEHSSRARPTRKLARMVDPSGRTERVKCWIYNHETHRHEYGEEEQPVYVDDPNRTAPFSAQHGWCEHGAKLGEDGVWRWSVRRHWLGDSIFRARATETRTRPATAEERAAVERYEAWERELRRLRGLQEQLPDTWQRGDLLKDEQQSRGYRRRRRDLGPYSYRRMLRLAMTGSRISELLIAHYERQPGNRPRVNDGRVPIRVTRWATYLSSFDYQEPRPLYFLCELPYGAKPNTVEEAIEALKPPEVVAALARGLAVIRQGDLFAIPTKLTKRQIRRMRGRRDFATRLRILGTNHSVSEGIVLKGGAVLGRGVMRHEPEGWRPPDHVSKQLGTAWHLLVRNTVPRTH